MRQELKIPSWLCIESLLGYGVIAGIALGLWLCT